MPNLNYTSDEGDHSFQRPRKPPPVVSFTPKDFAACRKIRAETLRPLLDLPEAEFTNKYILIDCRYPYEFDGGHVKYAINFHDCSNALELFYPDDKKKFEEINKKIPIFYCEFSQVRGPKMAQTLRQIDRERNEDRYPLLDYDEMYVLEGGYNNFYKTYKKQGCCVPDFYTPMNAKRHNHHLKKFTFHRTRSQASMKPISESSRASIRKFKRLNRLKSTQSCRMFPESIVTSTPNGKGTPGKSAPSMLDQELLNWRDAKRITSVASEWDSTIDGSFELENLSPIAKVPVEEEVEEVSSPNSVHQLSSHSFNSFCKPVQLSFGSE